MRQIKKSAVSFCSLFATHQSQGTPTKQVIREEEPNGIGKPYARNSHVENKT